MHISELIESEFEGLLIGTLLYWEDSSTDSVLLCCPALAVVVGKVTVVLQKSR